MTVRFEVRRFEELATLELYEILALRQRVFVVEQHCAYLDADGWDQGAMHVIGSRDRSILAYARILEPGVRLPERTIGRVIVAAGARGQGLARALMERSLSSIRDAHGPTAVALSAQAHLEPFYASLGFERRGGQYDEDGIPHVDMVRAAA